MNPRLDSCRSAKSVTEKTSTLQALTGISLLDLGLGLMYERNTKGPQCGKQKFGQEKEDKQEEEQDEAS